MYVYMYACRYIYMLIYLVYIDIHFFIQVIYVMPSSSARTMAFPRKADKLRFYVEIKKLRDEIKKTEMQAD